MVNISILNLARYALQFVTACHKVLHLGNVPRTKDSRCDFNNLHSRNASETRLLRRGAKIIFHTRPAVLAGTGLCLHSCGAGERCHAALWKSTELVETKTPSTSTQR